MFVRNTFLFLAFAIQLAGYSANVLAQQAKATKPADLLAEPLAGAAKSGSMTSGQALSVLDKKGFWVKVQNGSQSGWVKLTDVELPNAVTKIDPMSTGRTSSGNIVNTAGARGLSPEELKGSKPNTAAVDQAIQNAVKVQNGSQSGWVKLTDVELPNTVTKIDPMSTGRTSSGNIVNTAGARGLSPDELKGSKPNTAAVDQAIQNAVKVSDSDVSAFILSGGVVPRANIPEVKAVKVSSSGNVSKAEGVGMSATQSTSGSPAKSSKDKEW